MAEYINKDELIESFERIRDLTQGPYPDYISMCMYEIINHIYDFPAVELPPCVFGIHGGDEE